MTDERIYTGCGWCGKHRRVLLVPGQRYRVAPMNPLKKKHRGRICVVKSFGKKRLDDYAYVRWEDTGKRGMVSMADLVALDSETGGGESL